MRPHQTSPTSIEVRPWTPADDQFVLELAQEAFGEFDVHAGRYAARVTHAASARTFIAQTSEGQVGMVVVQERAGEWWIVAVAVSARNRARGIGARLLQSAEQHARAGGAERLSLFTADSNLAALDLFLRRGFRIVRRRTRFYSRGQDACELVKDLRRR